MKKDIQTIRKKFIKADYSRSFVNSAINQYNKIKEQETIPLYYLKTKNRLFY